MGTLFVLLCPPLTACERAVARRTSKLKLLPRLLFRAVDPATLRNSSLHKLDYFIIIASFDRHFRSLRSLCVRYLPVAQFTCSSILRRQVASPHVVCDDRPAKMRPANARRAATNIRCYVLVGDELNSSTALQTHVGLRLFNRDSVTLGGFDLGTVDCRSWCRNRVYFSGRRSSASWGYTDGVWS